MTSVPDAATSCERSLRVHAIVLNVIAERRTRITLASCRCIPIDQRLLSRRGKQTKCSKPEESTANTSERQENCRFLIALLLVSYRFMLRRQCHGRVLF
jgi:hypothetical protein